MTALLGRADEIAVLARFVDRVVDGPVGLLIEGDAGIGKTTLVEEAVRRATAAGYRVMFAGAVNGASRHTLAQAQADGWDGEPLILIGGHFHCSPRGKPGVQDIIDGTATSPSIVHQVFHADGTFAGTETLIRADLFAGQPCPTDEWLPVPPWLPAPTYRACHHFDFTP